MCRPYPLETRKNVLEMYRDGIPVAEIIRQTGVSNGCMHSWIREAGLPKRRQSPKKPESVPPVIATDVSNLTLEQKKSLIDGFKASKNKAAFAMEHNVSRSTLYSWSKIDDFIQDYQHKTINMKMYYEVIRTKEKLQQIVEVLQRVHCTASSPLRVKMAEMECLTDQYSINVLCEALCVNKTTFHHHLNDNKRENAWFNIRRNELRTIIEGIYCDHDQIPGVKKIQALLKKQGYNVSERIVRELMQDLGISSIRNNAKEIYLSKSKEENEINLKNMYPGDCPNQIWVSDFTYFRVQGKMFSVCIIMDCCSRRVLAYKVGLKSTTQMLTYCFNNAMVLRKPPRPLVFHSDQGAQYTSYSFKNLLKEHGVIQSFSRRGRPTDNAIIESFNSSFKREELYRHDFLSIRAFKEKIAEYIKYYNERRPHESLNYETPASYEQKYLTGNCPDTQLNS